MVSGIDEQRKYQFEPGPEKPRTHTPRLPFARRNIPRESLAEVRFAEYACHAFPAGPSCMTENATQSSSSSSLLDGALLDVLVIGSGGAGCAAAIEAQQLTRNIAILTKGRLDDSKTAQAQGGIQAAIGDDDSVDQHFEDTMRTGQQVNDPELVRILTTEAPRTVRWLEELGVQFDREGSNYRLQKAAGLSAPRVLSVGDRAGRGIVAVLAKQITERGIPCLENCAVMTIRRADDGFLLELLRRGDATVHTLRSRSIVLATGGFIPREKASGYADATKTDFPDGLALADSLGATIVAPDLVQYHPTGVIAPAELRRVRLPETMRAAGATLLNKQRKAFVDPMLTRNELTNAIVEECRKGNGVETSDGRLGVWLDTTQMDARNGAGFTAKNYPSFFEMFREHGHDLATQPVLIYPVLHYSLGGVQIDARCSTNVPGFFAAGEVAWGVHGRERLMGNSLLDIFVFGRIAGENAAGHALSNSDE
jgi:aspartate oxidase